MDPREIAEAYLNDLIGQPVTLVFNDGEVRTGILKAVGEAAIDFRPMNSQATTYHLIRDLKEVCRIEFE